MSDRMAYVHMLDVKIVRKSCEHCCFVSVRKTAVEQKVVALVGYVVKAL